MHLGKSLYVYIHYVQSVKYKAEISSGGNCSEVFLDVDGGHIRVFLPRSRSLRIGVEPPAIELPFPEKDIGLEL